MLNRPTLCALLGACALALSPSAQDQTPSGFALQDLPYPGSSATATLSNGDIVTFDGMSIDRFDSSGAFQANLGSFPGFVFGGCFAIDPSESFAVLGESSNGDVFRVELDGSGMTFLANLVFNFDADFESADSVIVSAATGGFGAGNDLVRLNTTTGATTSLAKLSGPSGPLAFNAAGLMFYVTQSDSFPSPPGGSDLVFLTPAQLSSGAVLGDADFNLFVPGFDGGSSLAIDQATGAIYLAENNFSSGTNRVYQVGGTVASSTVIAEGASFFSMGNLEVDDPQGGATFQAYQPALGGAVRYNTTDFFSTSARRQVTPARPTSSLNGPGASGIGAVDFGVDGGEPDGAFLFLYGPQGLYSPIETANVFGGIAAPIFTGLDLGTLSFLPFYLPLDGGGSGSFSFFNPGNLQGVFAFQALIADPALNTLGTSEAALL